MGRPKGHAPRNAGKTTPSNKKPARTAVPVVRALFDEIDRTGLSLRAIQARSGRHPVTLSYWRHGVHTPSMLDFLEVAHALDLELVLRPVSHSSRDDDGQTQPPDAD